MMAELGLVDPPQDGSPSWDEVEQREGLPELPILAVPVHVDGPVQVQQVPPRTSVLRTVVVGNQPEEVLAKDLRRSRAILLGDGPFVIGLTKIDCVVPVGSRANGATWIQGEPLAILGSSRVFAACPTPGGTVAISVIGESWAD